MKKHIIRITAVILAVTVVLLIVFISSCNKNGSGEKEVNNIAATFDEVVVSTDSKAIETSPNVNGMRFSSTLENFTARYNESKRVLGETDFIIFKNWQKHGNETVDDNGVKIQYYYYDDENTNFTATVEVDSNKILNIGFGTTMRYFMAQTEDKNNSETVLEKAALMAQSVCKYENGSTKVLKNIFRQTTTDKNDTIWFQNCVYKLDTQEDKKDSKNSIMLFRIFPISENLKDEWNLKEYVAETT
jgi:hypothetical protein